MFAWCLALWLSAAAWADPMDLNQASVEQLDTLPGIGPTKAAAIVAWRAEYGPFPTVDSLESVPGIGPATLASIRPLVVIGASAGAATPPQSRKPTPAKTPSAPIAATPGPTVNVNQADAPTLMLLPGIGETKAAAIVGDRTTNGPFAACTDLDRVPGIGPATIANFGVSCTTK